MHSEPVRPVVATSLWMRIYFYVSHQSTIIFANIFCIGKYLHRTRFWNDYIEKPIRFEAWNINVIFFYCSIFAFCL